MVLLVLSVRLVRLCAGASVVWVGLWVVVPSLRGRREKESRAQTETGSLCCSFRLFGISVLWSCLLTPVFISVLSSVIGLFLGSRLLRSFGLPARALGVTLCWPVVGGKCLFAKVCPMRCDRGFLHSCL